MFPVYLYSKDAELPKEGNYFLIAKNGVFMHKDVGIVQSLVKIDLRDVPMLDEIEPKDIRVCLKLPKLDAVLIYRCLLFFQRVWYRDQSEAALILYYNAEKQEYMLACPKQRVSGGGVRYGTVDGQPDPDEVTFISNMRRMGYKRVGTIHSHCNFNAFHSGIDTADEATFDGVHITIGHVDNKHFSLVSSLVVNNNRFQVDPQSIILGLVPQSGSGTESRWMNFREPTSYYDVDMTDEGKRAVADVWRDVIEKEWLPKVEKQVYTVVGYTGWWGGKKKKKRRRYEQEELFDFTGEEYDEESGEWRTHVSACVTPPAVEEKPAEETVPVVDAEPVLDGEPKKVDNDGSFLRRVKKHAAALRYHSSEIPIGRIGELLDTLKKFYKKDTITDEDIIYASQVNINTPSVYEEKGYLIHEKT